MTAVLDPKLLEILACPACEIRPPLALSEDGNWLICAICGRKYPIKDGIPVLIIDEAILPIKET